MFDASSPFGTQQKKVIPDGAQVVFVSDMFIDDYVGGAELTSEALIQNSPFKVFKLHSRDITMAALSEGADRFWVFGNFSNMPANLIPSIVGNLRYSVLEYDYKFCRLRSPEKHQQETGKPCDCHDQVTGKLVSAFYMGSMGLWWMSVAQKQRFMDRFPFLAERDNIVLSSVFDKQTLGTIKALREQHANVQRQGWIVLGSSSWVKGADDAEQWCKDNGKAYEVVWNLPYEQVLAKLAVAEGFVYLPKGGDTCPRMVCEAKLLGCKLHLNDNVQHKDEEWFATDDLTSIEEYLFGAPELFWSGIKAMMEYEPTISGYTTTYNCIKQAYPFEQCIKSMLTFCDEVCVVDGGSTDETLDRLSALQHDHPQLKVKVVPRDWSSKRHPVFDGMQKAEARLMCTKEFCLQLDCDEVVHEDDGAKYLQLARNMPKGVDLIALPVVEYWGGPTKVRMDVTPWKWRISRNDHDFTHGIPIDLRKTDDEGQQHALPGTDGCDMISRTTGERLQFLSFYSPEVDNTRKVALLGNEQARREYEGWFNNAIDQLPCVFHYSWYDIGRKIRLYRDYWQAHWRLLWDQDVSDTSEANTFFDVPWSQVTEAMIDTRARELAHSTGGHVFHTKWAGDCTPSIECKRSQPGVMREEP